jgi:hypothetical protein
MTVTLDATDPGVFARAVDVLTTFAKEPPSLRSANFAVAIAVLLHRSVPGAPTVGPPRLIARPDSGSPVSTGDLQTANCDATWEKDSAFVPAGADGPIYKPFTSSFKGRSPSTNNWRNSFDLQAGLGCDAPYTATFLRSSAYLAQRRFDCPFRDNTNGHCHSPAGNVAATNRTCFNPNKRSVPPGPDTHAQHTPKLLTRGTDLDNHQGYWFIEPTVDVLVDLLAEPSRRVPVLPFAAALYAGSPYFLAWSTDISADRLNADLALGPAEFTALFDLDPSSRFNVAMLTGSLGGRAAQFAGARAPAAQGAPGSLSAPVPYTDRPASTIRAVAGAEPDPQRRQRLLERANEGHQRTLNAIALELLDAGLEPTEQLDGYDLCAAVSEREAWLFEVKTWTPANLGRQTRSGWAQLIEYRHRNKDRLPENVRMFLVLDREPPADYWAWEFLVDELDITPCWVEGDSVRTLPQYAERLPSL